MKKKKKVIIRTPEELIAFIKREHVTPEQACELVREALSVFAYPEAKHILIAKVEAYVEKWWNYEGEKALFLDQLSDDFNIDVYYDPKI
jgi:hypothetical protein